MDKPSRTWHDQQSLGLFHVRRSNQVYAQQMGTLCMALLSHASDRHAVEMVGPYCVRSVIGSQKIAMASLKSLE